MILQYIHDKDGTHFSILDPKTLLGIVYDNKDIRPTSCRRGIPLRITENYYTTRSDKYSYIQLNKKNWDKINHLAKENNLQSSREILEEIENLVKNAPRFIQESNDMHYRKEHQILNSAA